MWALCLLGRGKRLPSTGSPYFSIESFDDIFGADASSILRRGSSTIEKALATLSRACLAVFLVAFYGRFRSIGTENALRNVLLVAVGEFHIEKDCVSDLLRFRCWVIFFLG